jgi:GntR family transcriptional regulator / MocR family aminotransferase
MLNPPFIALDQESDVPLYRQIYESVRRAILSGEFFPGKPLPASRFLAEQLGVSRTTVVNAYDQLLAEGYLESRTGAGTFVASQLPEDILHAPNFKSQKKANRDLPRQPKLSDYGNKLAKNTYNVLRNQRPPELLPFQHGLPALDKFPIEIWSKLTVNRQKYSSLKLFSYGEMAGFRPLREAIATHLKSARGVNCTPDQIIITNGTQQAIDLIGRILLNTNDQVWMEEPCYLGARDIFSSMGADISYVDIDNEGFNVHQIPAQNQTARLVYITPSHQFPLGVTMSLARRLNLLEWASKNNAWVIEDDYNSEYRYAGRPLASLQGLDRDGRVIYIGTFSKTIFPALRLGCLVVPRDLIEIFTAARALTDLHSPIIEQAVLADFISEGHFSRHIRRMRTLYEKRQAVLVEEVRKNLKEFIKIEKAESGMHIIGWLPENICAKTVAKKAAEFNLNITPVLIHYNKTFSPNGLMFGYAAFNENQIKKGVRQLAKAMQSLDNK